MLVGDNVDYFEWLIDKVGGAGWWEPYTRALVRLFERKYHYVNPIDAYVASIGKDLRTEAIIEGVEIISIPSDAFEVSVLEVLIALAEQIDSILLRSMSGVRRPERWFDDLMNVLNFKEEDGEIDIQIDRFLNGTNQITRGRRVKPFSRTIWEQVNLYYMDQFDLETDDF